MRRMIIVVLVLTFSIGLCACGKSDASRSAEEKIKAIGTVSLDSNEAIRTAESAYNQLSSEDKKEISGSAQILAHARAEYNELYNSFMKQKVKDDSQARVDKAINAIDAIGVVTLASKDSIQNAKFFYQDLSEEEQGAVTNYAVLTEAQEQLKELQVIANEEIVQKHKKNFIIDNDVVEGITWYKPTQMPQYINIRSYVSAYIGAQENMAWIVIVCNYTGDDWVFWDELTFLVDGVKYKWSSLTPNRSAYYGDVCEQYQKPLKAGQSIESEDIQLLQAIANSNETIVRFKGDGNHYDFTLTQQDKEGIKNVLAFYGELE